MLWSGFLIGQARVEIVPCRFCGGWVVLTPSMALSLTPACVDSRSSGVCQFDGPRSQLPRCLLWHVWLPSLSGNSVGCSRAKDNAEDVLKHLET